MKSMEQLIAAFPSNISEALEIASKMQFKKPEKKVRNVLICGMGGSGIGGTLVSQWLVEELSVPVHIVKDYNIPGFVSEDTLVIGSSYSGNTEETLSAVEQAIKKGAHFIGITSGGKMQAICEGQGYDAVIVPGGNPPRTALAYSIVQLINIFVQLGYVSSDRLEEIAAAKTLIESEEEVIKEKATRLAEYLKGKVGILYGTTAMEPVLIRARQQFNENSKALCWHHVIPEMNHNELVGWGGGDERFATVFFDVDGNHPRNDKRTEITKLKVSERSSTLSISAKGNSRIEQSIYIINIVDWASLYLAEMKDVDPVDIAVIDYLKSELSKF
jgi:glucose/mannose-6-phosphate isomerase